MKPQKIPIYLLTGFLGSGKTTLLKSWLADPLLQNSALIINELGEVGVDQGLLTSAAETSALVADACVCCTGLQGLSQALEDLFWARLQKRIHKFPQLIIETTGLAMPEPILETLQGNELLLERYEWAGTITCVSAKSYKEVLLEFKEAQAQLTKADLCILTKTDLMSTEQVLNARLEIGEFLAHHDLSTPLLISREASLTAPEMLEALRASRVQSTGFNNSSALGVQASDLPAQAQACTAELEPQGGLNTEALQPREGIKKETREGTCKELNSHEESHVVDGQDLRQKHRHHEDHLHDEDEGHAHHHHLHAQTFFWRMPDSQPLHLRQSQVLELKALLGHHLLRLKGWVPCDEGVQLLQMSPFDMSLQVQAFHPKSVHPPLASSESNDLGIPWGLTLIVKAHLPQEVDKALKALVLGPPSVHVDGSHLKQRA